MDEKLYTTLKNLGIDPSLVVPSNPITEVVDSTALNELIIKKLGVEKGEKVLEELRKAEQVHLLMKAITKEKLIPVKVWVKDPTKRGGGYYATRYKAPKEAIQLMKDNIKTQKQIIDELRQKTWFLPKDLEPIEKLKEELNRNKELQSALEKYAQMTSEAHKRADQIYEWAKKVGDESLLHEAMRFSGELLREHRGANQLLQDTKNNIERIEKQLKEGREWSESEKIRFGVDKIKEGVEARRKAIEEVKQKEPENRKKLLDLMREHRRRLVDAIKRLEMYRSLASGVDEPLVGEINKLIESYHSEFKMLGGEVSSLEE